MPPCQSQGGFCQINQEPLSSACRDVGWQDSDTRSRASSHQHSPSARGHRCQHKLAQVGLAAGLEQHGAVFSLLCLTLLSWNNVRVFSFVRRRKKEYNPPFFFFLSYFFLCCTHFCAWSGTKPGQHIFYPSDKCTRKGHKRQLWLSRGTCNSHGHQSKPSVLCRRNHGCVRP